MSELNAKDLKACPWGHPARGITIEHSSIQAVACSDKECGLYEAWMTPDQWNTRPRERELESQVAMLKEQVRVGDEASTFHMQASHKLRMRGDVLETALKEIENKAGKDFVEEGQIVHYDGWACGNIAAKTLSAINPVLGKGGE